MKERNLFQNGNLLWTRVRNASGLVVRRSTGTDDVRLARRIRDMHESMKENRPTWDLLDAVVAGKLDLMPLYNAYAAGKLDDLRTQRSAQAVVDPDLSKLVDRWYDDVLVARVKNNQITQQSADDYLRQVRVVIPEGEYFPASKFNEDDLGVLITALPFSGSTKRRYVAALRLFYRYARKRVTLGANPFEDVEWMPENNDARLTWWDHETRVKVLDAMPAGEFRDAMTLVLGTGIELGALVDLRQYQFGASLYGERAILVSGTKTAARRDRVVFVDQWAWDRIKHLKRGDFFRRNKLFPTIDPDGGNLRDAFYEAQVVAGLIAAPALSDNGKKLWKAAGAHTIHDSRHTYAVCRSLGLDGEQEQNAKFCAHQLGHSDETMVLKIYGKVNLDELRRRLAARKAASHSTQEVAA